MTTTAETVSMQGTCPNCQARPGEPCTQPTTTGRRPVTRFHYGRYDAGLTRLEHDQKG